MKKRRRRRRDTTAAGVENVSGETSSDIWVVRCKSEGQDPVSTWTCWYICETVLAVHLNQANGPSRTQFAPLPYPVPSQQMNLHVIFCDYICMKTGNHGVSGKCCSKHWVNYGNGSRFCRLLDFFSSQIVKPRPGWSKMMEIATTHQKRISLVYVQRVSFNA